ncbi:uncharacterized protein BCR38DRAFT_426254 [Pseudomassariella vexata]|uniref:Uncharacterized protein n=1 Tax=Pseudomassariella vexata TaxID=1141098 RepID=A0A1Y2E6L5_9PEZI|nr:uncharacterized protein BCR38DRAFT_426254 [Pseudomassariella vexata]ORY67172.1 hypothetical protein BCR38DRAFT_426254 [Pseudomassariella vexata]
MGTAAIALAKLIEAIVYTTCSSQAKRDYLMNDLDVPASHIFNSRDDSFVQGIRTATIPRPPTIV